MAELAKADIFFLITAIAVIIITVIVLIALFYIVKILRSIENITENVKNESKHIIEDVAIVRKVMERGGGKVGSKIKSVINKAVSLDEEEESSKPKKKNGSKKKEKTK